MVWQWHVTASIKLGAITRRNQVSCDNEETVISYDSKKDGWHHQSTKSDWLESGEVFRLYSWGDVWEKYTDDAWQYYTNTCDSNKRWQQHTQVTRDSYIQVNRDKSEVPQKATVVQQSIDQVREMKEGEKKVNSSMFKGSTLTKSTQKSELSHAQYGKCLFGPELLKIEELERSEMANKQG